MSYVPNIDKIKEILSQGTYSLVDEFEEEMVKHILEKETDSTIIYGCRTLVRHAFYITVVKYGKEATISNFCDIVLNTNDYGLVTCREVSRMPSNKVTKYKTRRVISYFFNEYYVNTSEYTGEYTDCKPVRHICELMLDSELIANGSLHF